MALKEMKQDSSSIFSPEMQTKEVWIYDFRTNVHFTLKQHPMNYADLQDFIKCYNPENRYERHETWSEENPDGRWRKYKIDDILETVIASTQYDLNNVIE